MEKLNKLNYFSALDPQTIARAAQSYSTPLYLYDEQYIIDRCKDCLEMPNAYGHTVRYAMKANSNRTLLKLISDTGVHFDASSLNEVQRAKSADIPLEKIMLTTQETYQFGRQDELEALLLGGLKYNVCSLRQLELIGAFASKNNISLGIRIHPGIGSGESATRNTGDDYSCFGIHLTDLPQANKYAAENGLKFAHIHVHIGSGGDMAVWEQNISLQLRTVEEHFPDAETVSFGGGLKQRRMPDEKSANVTELGEYAKWKVKAFNDKTGRKLKIEIEPGTFIMANAGYAVTRVIDKKKTARSNFIIADGGMEINSRPLLYGSRHPIYVVTQCGKELVSSEWTPENHTYKAVIAGKCCESGDSQTLDMDGHVTPRDMAEPAVGDYLVIGGVGAYCSSMAPFNYNSHGQIPEVLLTAGGELKLIRKRQTLEQIFENEI